MLKVGTRSNRTRENEDTRKQKKGKKEKKNSTIKKDRQNTIGQSQSKVWRERTKSRFC